MKPRLIITLCLGKLSVVADGEIDLWIETDHDTRKIDLETIPREDFDALLAGKMPEVII
jgi:hypothetical protein